MSNAPGRIHAESVTVLRSRTPSCDSIYGHYGINQEIYEQTEPDQTSPTYYQPNEQSCCIESSLGRTCFDWKESASNKRILQEKDKEEEAGQQTKSSDSKQAAEVAAAARFISKVDVVILQSPLEASPFIFPRPRLGSSASIRDSILDNSFTVSKVKATKMRPHSPTVRNKGARPPPLQLTQAQPSSEEIHTPLPMRISSKGAPSFDLVRPFDAGKQVSRNNISMGLDVASKNPPSVLTPESASTFQFDFVLPAETFPAEPRLSRSESGATTDSQSPLTPPNGPIEDHARRDIETFVLEQKSHLRGSSRRMRKPLVVDIDQQSEESRPVGAPLPLQPRNNETQATVELGNGSNTTPLSLEGLEIANQTLRRKKSIFGWLQKKPEVEVDEVIELYMNDEQREVKTARRKPSMARLAVFRTRATTDPVPASPG